MHSKQSTATNIHSVHIGMLAKSGLLLDLLEIHVFPNILVLWFTGIGFCIACLAPLVRTRLTVGLASSSSKHPIEPTKGKPHQYNGCQRPYEARKHYLLR